MNQYSDISVVRKCGQRNIQCGTLRINVCQNEESTARSVPNCRWSDLDRESDKEFSNHGTYSHDTNHKSPLHSSSDPIVEVAALHTQLVAMQVAVERQYNSSIQLMRCTFFYMLRITTLRRRIWLEEIWDEK